MKKIYFILLAFLFPFATIKAQWSELGNANNVLIYGQIFSICNDATGNVYAAGDFINTNFKYLVAKFNGSTWSELGGANSLKANNPIKSVYSDTAGNIYAVGDFTNASGNRYVAKFNGSTWSELGGANSLKANGTIYSVFSDAAGNIYAAGRFTNASNSCYVAKFNGSTWIELGGTNSFQATGVHIIQSLCKDPMGNIYAAGNFTNANSNAFVAKFNGSTWSELGGANSLQANSVILSLCSDVVGNIYAAGNFTNSNSKYYVSKFNGSTWSELGGTNSLKANSTIHSVCSDAAGNIYAAGWFTNLIGKRYVAKFNGSTWSELGGANSLQANGNIYSIFSDASGNIYAGGNFTNANSNAFVAKYSNTTVPLSFISFTAKLQNENTFLQWQTVNEINVSHFNVQYSTNGRDFYTLQTVNAKNNTYNEYAVGIIPPLGGKGGYYRIEAVDKDGKSTYSKTEKIQLNIDKEQLIIYPNPANNVVNISYKNIQQVSILDLTGRKLVSKSFNNSNLVQLNIASLSKGVYILQTINNKGDVQTQKLVIE